MSIESAIARLAPRLGHFAAGRVWLAGAGPGSVGCLTLEVVAALDQADAVVYDALFDTAVLRAAAAASLHFVGKRAGRPSTTQEDINRLLVKLARDGKRVLRLKGGDPNLFGRGGEEAIVLAREGVPFRFLTGITSGLAALARTNIPATLRNVNKAIILATGHAAGTVDDVDWVALARTGQPIIVYMGLSKLQVIASALIEGGLSKETPVAVIMAATTENERLQVADLETIALRAREAGLTSPALIVIGKIVAQRDVLLAATTRLPPTRPQPL